MPKATILLVDDSKFLRLANSHLLSCAGYTVLAAGDGQEGLRMARESHPDLILLDMLLPVLSGLDVLRLIRKDPAIKDIPVIVLSSLSKANAEKLREDGASGFVEKASLENQKAGVLIKAVEEGLRQSSHAPIQIP